MKLKTVLSSLLWAVMVTGFLTQMWDLFEQFCSGWKTIAVHFEERTEIAFPSFAICDSRAYRKLMPWTADAEQYNASTFNLEEHVSLHIQSNQGYYDNGIVNDWNSYTTELLPTIFNGYCMLYEFEREYPINTMACKYYRPYTIILEYCSSLISVFVMPANLSYDVFLLEKGTKLTLISQSYNLIQQQPTLTLTRHDTLLYISKTIHKILDKTCKNILASERMDCIIDKVQESNLTTEDNFCLPYQYSKVFPKIHSAFPQCTNNLTLSSINFRVS